MDVSHIQKTSRVVFYPCELTKYRMRLSWIPAEMKRGFNAYDYSIELKFGKSKTKFFLNCDVTSSSVGNPTPQKFSGVTQFTVSLHSFCL